MNPVVEQLDKIYEDLESNVIGIKNRRELMFAVDICYHSVLRFPFQGRVLEKGICEALVVGDTRTGKSHTVRALLKHYGLGDFIHGESCTLAGLLGGIDEGANGNRFVRCGRLPMSHRGLVVIDEANELDPETVGKMSGIRSSGVVDIVKIINQKIPCRTRLIWIANPRAMKSMAQFSYGVESIVDVIGKPEDIARFDIAVTVAHGDVDRNALYKTSVKSSVPHLATSQRCNALIKWVWSRRPSQVVLSDGVERRILDVCKELSEIYSETIPLVVETEQRNKVAKMAVAVAARTMSHSNWEKIVVTPDHVDAAIYYLRRCYDATSMDYRNYTVFKKSQRIDEKKMDNVLHAIGRNGALLVLNNGPSKEMLRNVFGDNDAVVKACWQELVSCNALEYDRIRRMWNLTGAGVQALKQSQSLGSGIAELPDPLRMVALSPYEEMNVWN